MLPNKPREGRRSQGREEELREGEEGEGEMSTATVVPETAEAETKTYWCHECDMSVALSSPSSSSTSSSTLLCPHCHTHFLELMDSPLFPQSDSHSFPASLSLFDTPYLHHLIQNHLLPSDDDGGGTELEYDDVLEDSLSLLSTIPNTTSKSCSDSVPTIIVTSSLLSQLDPGGVLCAVCKDPIGVDSQAKHLPCKHLYHSDCITPWLEHHNSCPLCRFQVVGEQEEEEEGVSQERRIRRQLRTAMMRLSELMEEEDDFYGLRTTLGHIASRHHVLSSAISDHRNDVNPSDSQASPQMTEAESVSAGVNDNAEPLSS